MLGYRGGLLCVKEIVSQPCCSGMGFHFSSHEHLVELNKCRLMLEKGISIRIASYFVPESYKYSLSYTGGSKPAIIAFQTPENAPVIPDW
jgi:hypothetical protein